MRGVPITAWCACMELSLLLLLLRWPATGTLSFSNAANATSYHIPKADLPYSVDDITLYPQGILAG